MRCERVEVTQGGPPVAPSMAPWGWPRAPHLRLALRDIDEGGMGRDGVGGYPRDGTRACDAARDAAALGATGDASAPHPPSLLVELL